MCFLSCQISLWCVTSDGPDVTHSVIVCEDGGELNTCFSCTTVSRDRWQTVLPVRRRRRFSRLEAHCDGQSWLRCADQCGSRTVHQRSSAGPALLRRIMVHGADGISVEQVRD